MALEHVDENELSHVTLIRSGAGACLRGHLKKSASAIALKFLNTDSCFSQMQGVLAQGGVCVERLVQPVGVYRTRSLTGLLWEWMPEGCLYSLLYETQLYPDLPLALRLHILLDVAEGLNILHAVCLPHGALKTTNVLLDHQYRAKLCDWGLQVTTSSTAPCFRDLAFLAPEVLQGTAPCMKSDMYSFGVLIWETLNRHPPCEGIDQLQNLIPLLQEKAEPVTDLNLLPPDTPHGHTLAQLMMRCWSADPEQRPQAEECVMELRKVLETLDSGAHCTAVQLVKASKEMALLSGKHTPGWEFPLELNNLEGYGGSPRSKSLMSKTIPVMVPYSHQHNARIHKPDRATPRGSPPSPVPADASPPASCYRDSSSHTLFNSPSGDADVRCGGIWAVKRTRASPPSNTTYGSPTSQILTSLHPNQTVCQVSSGWTCCQLLQARREAIVHCMTEGRLNNLLDVLRAKRAVTREDYEFITAAMTLSARTRCLLDTCVCLGEKVAILVATTLGLVSIEGANRHTCSRVSSKGQVV